MFDRFIPVGILHSLSEKKPPLGAQSSPIDFVLEKLGWLLSFHFFPPLQEKV